MLLVLQVHASSAQNDGERPKSSGERTKRGYQQLEQEGKHVRILYTYALTFTPMAQSNYLEKQYNDAQAQLRDIVSVRVFSHIPF